MVDTAFFRPESCLKFDFQLGIIFEFWLTLSNVMAKCGREK